MKLRGSHKIAIGGLALASAAYFGWQAYSARVVDNLVFPELKPGKFTIVGVDTGKGYKVLVANQVAQLVELEKDVDFGGDDIESATSEQSLASKRRVPLRDMLESMQGNEAALGRLVTALNDALRNAEMPAAETIWTASDLSKALAGDAALKLKLEQNLNVHLDGTPLAEIRPNALRDGIVVEATVPISVSVGGKITKMQAPIKMPFRAEFSKAVVEHYKEEVAPTSNMIRGFYLQEAQRIADDPRAKQDIAGALKDRIDADLLAKQFAPNPTRILENSNVVLTEDFVENAEVVELTDKRGRKLYNLILNLTDEGRKRMWQYSRRGIVVAGKESSQNRTQLLVIHDGIAIAAPRVKHELPRSEISISQIPEKGLVNEAADFLNHKTQKP
ncbi:MAG: hypothetical protein ABL949_08395 [Fimbriimonadaceae bacterium]